MLFVCSNNNFNIFHIYALFENTSLAKMINDESTTPKTNPTISKINRLGQSR